MILWTIMPLELVYGQQDVSSPYEEVEYDGTQMMVERVDVNQYRVIRIFSTDPQDYLRQDIQPGAMLTFQPAKL